MSEVAHADLEKSLTHCRRVVGRLQPGLRLTPEPKRSAIVALYAWAQQAQGLAQPQTQSQGNGTAAAQRLQDFRQQTDAAIDPQNVLPEGETWPAIREAVQRYAIVPGQLHGVLDGIQASLGGYASKDFDELYRHCYRNVSLVGLVCVKIWGDDGHRGVAKLAEYRGVALGLTEVLRDLKDDARRGRVLLPADDLERFGVTPDDLVHARATPAFRRLMQFQLERTRSYYEMSATLERHLSTDGRPASWAMMRAGRVLLERIADRPERVLRQHVRLAWPTTATLVAGAAMKRDWA